jgi:hypothetical protein
VQGLQHEIRTLASFWRSFGNLDGRRHGINQLWPRRHNAGQSVMAARQDRLTLPENWGQIALKPTVFVVAPIARAFFGKWH